MLRGFQQAVFEGLGKLFDGIEDIVKLYSDEKDVKGGVTSHFKEFMAGLVGVDRASCCVRVGFIREYLDYLLGALEDSGYGFIVVDAVLGYRGIVGSSEGLGRIWFMPLWHPLFDVPWIPGSSVKGVLRASYEAIAEQAFPGDMRKCSSIIFGCSGDDCPSGVEARVGLIKALDAYPVDCGLNGGLVEADVITAHYGEDVETELDVKPNPILGLSLSAGSTYRFIILFDNNRWKTEQAENCLLDYKSPLDLAYNLLFYALENVGVGGKTTRGYGYFNQIQLIEIKNKKR